MKHVNKITTVIVSIATIIMLVTACGGTSKNSLPGTWSAESAEYNGSTYTVSELEAMGDYSISELYVVIKEGGSAYVSDGGSGAMVEWSQQAGGIKLGIQDCKVVDGKIILENNGVTITLAKQSDSQEVTTAASTAAPRETKTASETTTIETAENSTEGESSTEKKDEDKSKDLDPKLLKILEEIKAQINEKKETCTNGADQLLSSVGDSYDAYKANVEAISNYYDSNKKSADELYAYLETASTEFFRAVADLKMSYSGWNAALDEFYDVWNDGVDDYYDAWNSKYDELYDKFNEIIDDSSESIDYSEYHDTWSEMYNAYSDSWSEMYNAYSDSWSLIYNNYSDVWSGFYKDIFDVDAILNDKN